MNFARGRSPRTALPAASRALRPLLGALAMILPACAAPSRLVAAELATDFTGARLDRGTWKTLDPVELTRPDPQGLTIQITAAAGAVPSAGIAARFGLRGDFEITADFEIVEVPTPKSGFGAGATISLSSADGQGASMQRVHFPDGKQAYVCHRATPQPDGTVKHTVEVVETKALAGRMRAARVGSELRYFAAEGGGGAFRELRKAAFSNADVRLLHLAAQTGEAPNPVSIRWKKFEAQADELLDEQGKSAGDRRLVIWGGLGAAGVFVAGLVFLKRSARRSAPNRAP
ncbi:MAG TPA: DUF1583 domain-containing protein [Pirellulales bacterium]